MFTTEEQSYFGLIAQGNHKDLWSQGGAQEVWPGDTKIFGPEHQEEFRTDFGEITLLCHKKEIVG